MKLINVLVGATIGALLALLYSILTSTTSATLAPTSYAVASSAPTSAIAAYNERCRWLDYARWWDAYEGDDYYIVYVCNVERSTWNT